MYLADYETLVVLMNFLGQHPAAYFNFSSELLVELRKRTDTNAYYVNASFNGQELLLPGTCQRHAKCEFKSFVTLAKDTSFYGNLEGYRDVCGVSEEDYQTTLVEEWIRSFPRDVEYMSFSYWNVLWWYLILMVCCSYLVYKWVKDDIQKSRKMLGRRRKP